MNLKINLDLKTDLSGFKTLTGLVELKLLKN